MCVCFCVKDIQKFPINIFKLLSMCCGGIHKTVYYTDFFCQVRKLCHVCCVSLKGEEGEFIVWTILDRTKGM